MRINHKTRTNYVLLFNFVLFVDLLKKKKKLNLSMTSVTTRYLRVCKPILRGPCNDMPLKIPTTFRGLFSDPPFSVPSTPGSGGTGRRLSQIKPTLNVLNITISFGSYSRNSINSRQGGYYTSIKCFEN